MKLCVSTRDEVRLIELRDVVYIRASGNYTDFHLVGAKVRSELTTLTATEQRIARLCANRSLVNPFLRAGRSLLVNIHHIASVNTQKRQVSFDTQEPPLTLPKEAARQLKGHLEAAFGE